MSEIIGLKPFQLIKMIPQQPPFRFVDEIEEVNRESIIGNYTFREDEFFYPGHFPFKPITPGVILLESMCQIGLVAFGIYLLSLEEPLDEVSKWTTMFCDAKVEFYDSVLPGEKVTVKGEKIFWKLKKLRSHVKLYNSEGKLVAEVQASGLGVKNV